MDYYNEMACARDEGIKIGEAKGISIGKEEGERKTKLLTAQMMLNENCPIETISRITGLANKEIEGLK